MIHKDVHQMTGKQVIVTTHGKNKTIHDWFDRVHNQTWENTNTIPVMIYKIRVGLRSIPKDNEVVVCKDGALYHVSEVIPIN